jgi:N-acetylglutamate synthase-like GNAT family acetyltransferase
MESFVLGRISDKFNSTNKIRNINCYIVKTQTLSIEKMEIVIKEYKKKDRIGCINAFKSNVPAYFTNEEVQDFETFLTRLDSDSNKTRFYVIHDDTKIIGCGGFGDKDNKGIISLAWGLIHKDFHKKGYGKKLLLYRIDQIKLLRTKFPVIIDTTQYSYGFFEKYGFKTTKITNDYYQIGMHRYDMTLEI